MPPIGFAALMAGAKCIGSSDSRYGMAAACIGGRDKCGVDF